MGMPPSGKRVEIGAFTLHRFSGRKIAEDWTNYDALGMMRQIGAVASPEQQAAEARIERPGRGGGGPGRLVTSSCPHPPESNSVSFSRNVGVYRRLSSTYRGCALWGKDQCDSALVGVGGTHGPLWVSYPVRRRRTPDTATGRYHCTSL